MRSRTIIAYWNTVLDCLVEFYGVDRQRAGHMVSGLRDEGGAIAPPRTMDDNLLYHAEPIHIAADLMHKEPVRDAAFYSKYRLIQKRNLELARRQEATKQAAKPSVGISKSVHKQATRSKRLVPAKLVNSR